MDRINKTRRAIHTFKNLFLTGLASVDLSYPINEWDRLLQQAAIILNILRTLQINPKLSVYACLYTEILISTKLQLYHQELK